MTLYADDADTWVEDQVTDTRGNDLTFDPVVIADDELELTAEWQGAPGPTRVLRTTVGGHGLAAGVNHDLRLVNPNGNDLHLEEIYLH